MAYANVLTPGMFHPGDGNNYPTHEDIYGKGGFMVTSDKENISQDRLKVGMYVHDPSAGKIYELTSKTPATWEEVNLGGTQIPADWNQSDDTQLDFIKNKPNFQVITEDEIDAAFSGVDLTGNYIIFGTGSSAIRAYRHSSGDITSDFPTAFSDASRVLCFAKPDGTKYFVKYTGTGTDAWNESTSVLTVGTDVYDSTYSSTTAAISGGTSTLVVSVISFTVLCYLDSDPILCSAPQGYTWGRWLDGGNIPVDLSDFSVGADYIGDQSGYWIYDSNGNVVKSSNEIIANEAYYTQD